MQHIIKYIKCYAKSLQSFPTLCDPIDSSLPGSPIPGILQARTLEWAAISFSNAWKWKVKVKSLSHVQLLATPWTAGCQAPPPMGFSRQEYWSGVPLPSPSLLSTLHLLECRFHKTWPVFSMAAEAGKHPGEVHRIQGLDLLHSGCVFQASCESLLGSSFLIHKTMIIIVFTFKMPLEDLKL